MNYRVVKVGDVFLLEACFPRGRLTKWFLGEPYWYWIHTYHSLEDAIRGRDFLIGDTPAAERVVVA